MFIETVSQLCSCFQLPPWGKFRVGVHYSFEYLIDAERVMDDSGDMITFPEKIFKSHFNNLTEAITSYSPILMDSTIYSIYFIIKDLNPSLDEIKVYAKIKNVNYIQAKKALTNGRNLIFSGSAYSVREILKNLNQFQVSFEIEPVYPYLTQ